MKFTRSHYTHTHTQMQGKVECYHQSMKRVIKLQHYFAPSELEEAIDEWVLYYNEQRYHEALGNLKPIDIYRQVGTNPQIREQLKRDSLYQRYQANKLNPQSSFYYICSGTLWLDNMQPRKFSRRLLITLLMN